MPTQVTTTDEELKAQVRALHEAKQRGSEPRMGVVPVAPVTGKAGEILQSLHPGEPVFVFRAKDLLSVWALDAYAAAVEKYEPNGDHLVSIVDAAHDFRQWQKNNPSLVKLPD